MKGTDAPEKKIHREPKNSKKHVGGSHIEKLQKTTYEETMEEDYNDYYNDDYDDAQDDYDEDDLYGTEEHKAASIMVSPTTPHSVNRNQTNENHASIVNHQMSSNLCDAETLPFKTTTVNEIKQVVKNYVFPKVKFIVNQKQLDDLSSNVTLGRTIMSRLNIHPNQYRAFWNTYKVTVNKALNSVRNSVQTAVKQVIREMLLKTKKFGDTYPNMRSVTEQEGELAEKKDETKLNSKYSLCTN